MHRWIALALLLLPASAALAYAEPRLDPDALVMKPGDAVYVGVTIHHISGLNPYMWGFDFSSSNESVMYTSGHFEHPRWSGTILVEARTPGTAEIIAGGKVWGTVTVQCSPEAPIEPLDAHHFVTRGGNVTLSITATALGRVLQWYEGRVGDTSRPLAAIGPDYVFTSNVVGPHYVWVSATTPCSSSTAEFRIDVTQPRRRAVRRR